MECVCMHACKQVVEIQLVCCVRKIVAGQGNRGTTRGVRWQAYRFH